MKKLNFLSNLCSSSRADRVRTLYVDAVSLPSFCRVNMLKFVSVLVLILTVGVGNAWAQSTTYTSNVTLSTSGGTNAYDCTIKVTGSEASGYTGIRIGKSKNNGSMQFTVPSGTTTIYLHAAAWSGEAGAMTATTSTGSITAGASMSLTADASISGKGPNWTLHDGSKASTSYFFTLTLSGITSTATITLTSASKKRAVVWGVNYVAGGGCDKEVSLATSLSNCTATFTPSGPVKTCSATASDRQVSVSITPTTGYALTSGPTVSGIASATISGSGPYTIQLPQNGNGTLTLSATCTAISVTGVSLNKSSTTIVEGNTETLTATVTPSNALNKAVTWSSGTPGVATVSSSGVVTAVSAGNAIITVTTHDGSFTANCTVTVTAAARDHFIDAMHSTSGYTGDGMEKVGNYSASIPSIADKAKNTTGTCQEKHYHFAGWVTAANRANPEGNLVTLDGNASNTTYYAVWEEEAAGGGGTSSITITRSTTGITATGYGSGVERTWTQSEIDFGGHYIATNVSNTPSGASASQYIVLQKNNGTLYNTEELPGAITEVEVIQYSALACNVYCGDERLMASDNTSGGQTPSGTLITKPDDATTMTWTISASNNYKFFALKAYTSSSSGTNYITSVKVTYSTVTYEDPKAVCEACVATPSISGVSLTGSAFSTTSVPVQATGASAGENCSLAEYGFYWGGSANPSTNNTASDNLSTGTFSATLTGPFTIGETYHYRAYATNEAPNTGYSSDATFTLRQVSFNMHSHGGDAPATQVVPQGGKATDPGNPSATGWTFGGWYDNDSYTGSAWDFGTNTVGSGNVTLHAKWTEKPKYTVTLNAGNGTISDANWTNTSGSTYTRTQANGDEEITLPTPSCNCAGWVFQGWSTTSKDNAVSFTPDKEDGASFVPANDVTYFAVYRQSSAGGTTYSKITSAGDLTTGNYVITGMYNGTTPYKMDGSLYNEGVSLGESSASVTDGSLTESTASYVWTIIKFGSSVVFRNTSTSKFLAIVDGKFALQDEGQLFTYSVTSGAWTFTSPSGKQIIYATRYNVGDSQNREIHLYKQGSTPSGNFYTNPTCSDLSITGVADPAAGGSVTLSTTSAKSGEKVYAYYTPDEDYNFTDWSISGTGSTLSSTSAQLTEITVGTANTTVTANFAAKDWKTVTWKANGEALTGGDLGSASVKVENGYDITAMPPTPASCDGTSTNFIGWVAESDIWSGKTDDVSGVTIYEKIADFPTVTGNVVYHAVWAHQIGTPIAEIEDNSFTSKDENGTYCNAPFSLNAAGKYLQKQSIWTSSQMQNVTVKIRVFHVANNTAATLRVSLINSDGDEVVGSDLTAGVTGNNISNGGYTDWVELIPTSAVTGYKVSMKTPAAHGTAISKVAREVVGSGAEAYLVKCCNTPTLTFAASPYAVLREDIQGASTTTWAEMDVTFTSNSSGEISATKYSNATVTNGTAYQLAASKWQVYETTGGTLCGASHAYFEVLTQPSGETPGTGKFHVKTAAGQTGQGTYRIAITQEGTDESHGNYCETTVYGFINVTLRDQFVDKLNGNGTVTRDGHGAQLAAPSLSDLDTQVENACHSEGRKLKGWIKETDLKAKYETGNSERVQTIDGLCETCDNATPWTSLVVAPGENVTTSGATWYAVWAYEK